MSRISDRSTAGVRRAGRGGFTLVELMIACTMAAIVFAAIFAAYIFLGRNLTRLMNFQEQEVQARKTIRYFTADVGAAIALSTASSTSFTLSKPTSGGTTTVTYSYSALNGVLQRIEGGVTQTLLSGVTAITFEYYTEAGSLVSGSPQSVKAVEISFTTADGNATIGTRSTYSLATPRVVLRNKTALQ